LIPGNKKKDTPIQAADYVAWLIQRHFHKLEDITTREALQESLNSLIEAELGSPEGRRRDFLAIVHRRYLNTYLYNEAGLMKVCKQLGIPRR
jgi:hypothetical protein